MATTTSAPKSERPDESSPVGPEHRAGAPDPVGQWDIAPGETKNPDGTRDVVLEGSMESFPASDPPAW